LDYQETKCPYANKDYDEYWRAGQAAGITPAVVAKPVCCAYCQGEQKPGSGAQECGVVPPGSGKVMPPRKHPGQARPVVHEPAKLFRRSSCRAEQAAEYDDYLLASPASGWQRPERDSKACRQHRQQQGVAHRGCGEVAPTG
jgi:hypothetical protein